MSKFCRRNRPEGMNVEHDPTTIHLLDCIEANVQRLAASLAGLDETALRSPVVRSGWTMLGLVGHVRDSSYFWLHHVILGHPMTFNDADERWDNSPITPTVDVVKSLVSTVSTSCRAVRHLRADAEPGWWPNGAWGGYRQDTVLGVLAHLLVDNAAHAGHLDIARELTDGEIWDLSSDSVKVTAP